VQSITADSISPARLRILDSSHKIISEFIIDKAGVMSPITKLEHDADLARRKAALSGMPPANHSGVQPDNPPPKSDTGIQSPENSNAKPSETTALVDGHVITTDESKESVALVVSGSTNLGQVLASACLLVDATTGKILYERNADEPHMPAGTVKLMTGLITFESLPLDHNLGRVFKIEEV
jgi:hypothetical protein